MIPRVRRSALDLRRPAFRQFLISFAAGVTALGITNLLQWLREPSLRRRS